MKSHIMSAGRLDRTAQLSSIFTFVSFHRMSVGAGLLFFASLLAIGLSYHFRRLNAQRDTMHGPSLLNSKGASFFQKQEIVSEESSGAEDRLDEGMLEDAAAGADWVHFRYIT